MLIYLQYNNKTKTMKNTLINKYTEILDQLTREGKKYSTKWFEINKKIKILKYKY